MFRRLRRPSAPPEVQARLDGDDVVLAVARSREGRTLTATRRGLWVTDESSTWLVPWECIVMAVWAEGVLTVTEGVVVAEYPDFVVMERGRPWRADVPTPGGLHGAVRAQVTRSVAVTERHDLAGRGILVTARREGGTNAVRWAVVFDEPGAYRDPVLVERAAALVSAARSRRSA